MTSKPAHGPDLPAYFDELLAMFESAARLSGRRECTFRIAENPVRLCFAGDELVEPLTSALRHLEDASTAFPALTVRVWDSRFSGARKPRPGWSNEQYGARGEITGFESHRFFVHYETRMEALTMLDLETGRAVFWIQDAARIPWWEKVSPLRVLLNRWADQRGMLAVHAAGVGTPKAGALMVGGCGSGKSTTAFACVHGGFRHAGDDTLLVALSPTPTAYSVYSTAKLTEWSLAAFPHLRQHAVPVSDDSGAKSVFFLHQALPDALIDRFPLKAILLPAVSGGGTTRFSPAPGAAALKALAPSSILPMPGAGSNKFRAIAQLVRCVPSYFLHLAPDLERMPSVLTEILGLCP